MSRRPHGDDGAALILAMAFITVVALGVTAVLTLADTGQRTTIGVRAQGAQLYAANGGIDQAITKLRGDTTLGKFGGPCPQDVTQLNGVTTTVRCTGAAGSGAGAGGPSASNTPANAILALAPFGGEDGLAQESNGVLPLRINGPVVSNSGVSVSNGGQMLITGPLTARGACVGNIGSTPVPDCTKGGTATIPNSTDPDYGMHPDAPAVQRPAAAPAVQGCSSPGQKLVVLSPGTYTSASALNSLFTTCAGSVFWFKPGFYYFDFIDNGGLWTITNSQTHVVGGVPARWSPTTPDPDDPSSYAPGSAAPTVPFPVDAVPATGSTPAVTAVPGACVTSLEKSDTKGVQFAFGGSSRVAVTDAKVELCAQGGSGQHIAVYGVSKDTTPVATAPTQQTAIYSGTGTITAPGDVTSSDPANAETVNGQVATTRSTSATPSQGSTASVVVAQLATTATVPSNATIDSVALRIVQRPVNGNVSALKAEVRAANDALLASATDANNNCTSATTTSICRETNPGLYDQRVALSAANFTPTNLANSKISLQATLKTTGGNGSNPYVFGEEQVDALQLEVKYTVPVATPAPGYNKLSGCAVQPMTSAGGGGCAVITTTGSPTRLAVHGTMYAPTGGLRLELTNNGTSAVDRGVVVRAARITVTGSSAFAGNTISLPPVSPTSSSNRKVVFVASQGSVDVLRAVVTFDDNGTVSADKRADVVGWSVLR